MIRKPWFTQDYLPGRPIMITDGRRTLLVFAVLAAAGLWPVGVRAEDAPDPQTVERLVKQLGADDFAGRQAAQAALVELGPDAVPALEKAIANPDPEVSARAREALKAIRTVMAGWTHRLVDAVGQPIALAKADVVTVDPQTGTETPIVIVGADRWGYISLPRFDEVRGPLFATLADARFVRARAAIQRSMQSGTGVGPPPPAAAKTPDVVFPFVLKGHEAFERALKGQVLDPLGNPVPNAIIACSEVRTPGEGLIQASETAVVLTDEQGRFEVYPPPSKQHKEERGQLIPPNSRFHLVVRPPPESGLFPLATQPANIEPAKIVLERPARARSFRFEKPDGGWFEPSAAELRSVYVRYSRKADGGTITLDPRYVRSEAPVLNGFYSAQFNTLEYRPIEVADASSKVLEFRFPPPARYQGQVLLAPDGKPAAGAFVIAMTGTSHNNLALLSDREWDALEKLPAAPGMDDPAVAVVGKLYAFLAIARTDAAGRYQITTPRGQDAYGMVAFARDRLPFMHRTYKLKAGPDGMRDVPALPLYPAAKVLVRPALAQGHVALGHSWALAPDAQPDWADAFRQAGRGSEREFERLHWLKLNEQQPIYVPAGLRVRVRFSTPYDENWTPKGSDEVVALEPGQTKDLGDVTFIRSAKVSVTVLGPGGRPVEGIPLRMTQDGSNSWCVAHNTDAAGQAQFHAPPGSSGKIAVVDFPDRKAPQAKADNVTVPFQAGPNAEQPTACEIRLTKEQIEFLLGSAK